MQIQDQIITTIPIFEVTETLEEVIQFFEETTFSHVAVTENGVYLGVLSDNDLACFQPDKKIEEFRVELETFFATKQTAWLDLLELFSRNEANVLPVLDDDNIIIGYYDLEDIVSVFIDTPFFREPGGILVVSTGIKDYSFSEIAQIVESNNARLLGAFITDSQNDVVQITLKVGTLNLNEVAQTFRRYNYTIIFGNSDDQFLEDLKQRSDYLEKYLNV
ncbi:CBS domain-containing protein [Flagellimonas sp. HMM57]|uniref:CBS domain-containing protein n=1 Tax=unclassified Flagellimonas TaxID=2644544 RepID=UPI0013D451E6|nr:MULTISPECIES: CBS domain-containing protein [unclassified Flagellimonas]UII76912.1 CBS domain-containing protein [Flagellimonas sp. HMM57]